MKKVKIILIALLSVIVVATCTLFGLSYYGLLAGLRSSDGKASDGQTKVACVGDSITYGFGVQNWYKYTYPKELQKMLGDGYHVKNFGYSGATAMSTTKKPYTKQDVYKKSLEYLPDIVVIMLGSNDSKTYHWKGKEEFKKQYGELLKTYINLKSEPKIYLCTLSTAYYVKGKTEGTTTFDIQGNIIDNEIKECVNELGNELQLEVIDINEVTKNHAEWYKYDGVHPNNKGAKKIAETIWARINVVQ